MELPGITDLLPIISFSLFALYPPFGEYYWARWEPYPYWARWLYTYYREQGAERDEAESRRHLQCSVKHDSWTLPCAPLTLAITETCGHSQLQESWKVQTCAPQKILIQGKKWRKDIGVWRVPATIWLMIKRENEGVFAVLSLPLKKEDSVFIGADTGSLNGNVLLEEKSLQHNGNISFKNMSFSFL